MIIKILSRNEIESDYYSVIKESSMPHIIISTTSDRNHPIVEIAFKRCCREILRFGFDDIDTRHVKILEDREEDSKLLLFHTVDAMEILQCVNKNIGSIQAIICQCDAGISRSASIGSALSKILNNEDDYFFKNYIPNMLIYTTILNEYYGNIEKYNMMEKYFYKHLPEWGN